MDKTDLNLISKRMSLKVPICLEFLARQFQIDNFSIIRSGAMNAKLSLWTVHVRFLPVKALIRVAIDLASLKSSSLQIIGFFAKPQFYKKIVRRSGEKWSTEDVKWLKVSFNSKWQFISRTNLVLLLLSN